MELKGSRTEQNLYKTFAGESRARSRYNLYAERARLDGYQWVGAIFDEIANNELAHAREAYGKFLNLVICTKNNLEDCILGERSEYEGIYKKYEEEARAEGFTEIADFYKELAETEENHAETFKVLYDRIEDGTMFKGPKGSLWVCMNCGYVHEGEEAPIICPLCKYPRAYYKPYYKISND